MNPIGPSAPPSRPSPHGVDQLPHSVERSTDIHADTHAIWSVLADEFDTADRWNSLMWNCTPHAGAEPRSGAPIRGRTFQARLLGAVTEVISEFDPNAHRLAYRPTPTPAVIADLTNSWRLDRLQLDVTRVTMVARFETAGIGRLLARPLGRFLGRSGTTMLTDLKTFVETGQQSPASKKSTDKRTPRPTEPSPTPRIEPDPEQP